MMQTQLWNLLLLSAVAKTAYGTTGIDCRGVTVVNAAAEPFVRTANSSQRGAPGREPAPKSRITAKIPFVTPTPPGVPSTEAEAAVPALRLFHKVNSNS